MVVRVLSLLLGNLSAPLQDQCSSANSVRRFPFQALPRASCPLGRQRHTDKHVLLSMRVLVMRNARLGAGPAAAAASSQRRHAGGRGAAPPRALRRDAHRARQMRGSNAIAAALAMRGAPRTTRAGRSRVAHESLALLPLSCAAAPLCWRLRGGCNASRMLVMVEAARMIRVRGVEPCDRYFVSWRGWHGRAGRGLAAQLVAICQEVLSLGEDILPWRHGRRHPGAAPRASRRGAGALARPLTRPPAPGAAIVRWRHCPGDRGWWSFAWCAAWRPQPQTLTLLVLWAMLAMWQVGVVGRPC